MTAVETFSALYAPPSETTGGSLCIPALTGSADAFLATALAIRDGRIVLAVTPGLPQADRLADDLRLITAKMSVRILEFPPAFEDDKGALGARLKTRAALCSRALAPYPAVLVVSYAALASPVPSASVLPLKLEPGKIRFAEARAKIAAFGYRRVSAVAEEGDWSVRGDILDVWSPDEAMPVRAEFFGEDLESLRSFDPGTQVSVTPVESADVLPISSDSGGACTFLTDLLPEDTTILAIDHAAYGVATVAAGRGFPTVYVGDPPPPNVPTYAFQTAPLPGFAELGAEEAHHPELFEAARTRLDRHIAAAERGGSAIFRIDALSGGFELPGLVVVTKADRVFTKHRLHTRRTAASGPRLEDFENLEPGEYVVHVDYGVGRYVGSSEITVAGRRSEVFTIEYADGAKLHVPAAHAHLLSRYVGVRGEAVHLHRLDGRRWEKDKADAEKAIADLASALLETQARREIMPGYRYDVACDGLDAFEAAFPYEETEDQLAGIAAIKADLARTRPMDRLICGDAGYGKTELAMRAAYIVAMNGRQVAVLAPTTILAEQHFETFASRFDGTPLRIESVSRFQTSGTHAGTFERLASGVCDIVIGTHAILNPRIRFHDLGLIIIDEEQRFGVRQKEFLKSLRETADVLTLSATPIPRTLYLSMTGARDLSLLRTPPRERVAVDTRVVRDADETIRAAIEAEIARDGQVFFLHNRVTTISRTERRLAALCPNARIVVAHGQMDAATLARKMRAFERGDYDILLSTTIVESGIDIPRANTILVDRADMFGMADLYQLRGRVGRSAREGHAYFLLPPSGDVDAEARERLAALRRHGGLGAGFNLAVRDLELRGAGNLLGAQQSGHIAAVGFGLYCQLLKRTVARLKGEKVQAIVDVKINLDFVDARLPAEYVEDDVQRFGLLRRFAEAQDEKAVRALARELKDRYGPMPDEVRQFVRIAELRVTCAKASIDRVDARDARAFFYRAGSREVSFVRDLTAKTPDRKIAEIGRLAVLEASVDGSVRRG